MTEEAMNTWVFQANPNVYRVDAALKALSEHTWLTNQHFKHIVAGDEVFIWRCGKNAALVAVGTVLSNPTLLDVLPEERRFEAEPLKFYGKRLRVRIRTKVVNPPVPREVLLNEPGLSSIAIFPGWNGTNFAISGEIAAAVHRVIDPRPNGQG
jgi:hypothetical protein